MTRKLNHPINMYRITNQHEWIWILKGIKLQLYKSVETMGKLGDLQFLTIFKVRCLLSQGSLFFNHYLTFIIGLNLNWNPPTRWQYPFLCNEINLLPDNDLWVSFKRKESNCRLLQCSGVLASKGSSLQIELLNCSNMKLSRACIAAVLTKAGHTSYLSLFLHNHNLRPENFTLESA